MKNFIKFTIGLMTVALVFGAFSVFTQNSDFADGMFSPETAFAQSTCGSCDPDPDPTPDPDPEPEPPTCDLTLDLTEVDNIGDSYRIEWNGGPSSASFFINGSAVPDSGHANFTFTGPNYDRFHMVGNNDGKTCDAEVRIIKRVVEVPSCDAFTATPGTLSFGGGTVTLDWATTNATNADIDGQSVAGSGTWDVEVTGDKTFTLNLSNVAGTVACTASADVEEEVVTEAPRCVAFTASPTSLPYGGGQTTLTWEAANADSITIDNGVLASTAVLTGTTDVTVTNDITYTMTVSAAGYDDVTCPASITVRPQVVDDVFTCEDNVTFSAGDTSLPKGGGDVTFTWAVTGADSVSISGITSTNHSDTEVVPVQSDQTFTLNAVKAGYTTLSCPVFVDVKTGGGGSSSPRCDLDISDEKIRLGEEITLTWDTSRAREVKITDNHGNVLLDTEDSDEFDGKMTIKPTEDTEYTLLSKKGTREKECKVEVELGSSVTVLETRTHDPRVAGISLTQVPYTGFEAGPAMTMIFYALLTIWGLFVAYIFVIRRDSIGGVSLAGAHDHVDFTDVSVDADTIDESSAAEGYVDAVVASTVAPTNLPTAAPSPVIGYAATVEDEATDESIEMTELENRAHAQKVLLSSDAMRFLMNATESNQRNEKLDAAITQAKASFPSEAGWVALNLARIETLISDKDAEAEVETQTAPITGGSLAEAIIAGNVVSAYQLIAHRPMIALADAATDLDAVYRSRKGEEVAVSNMLTTSAAAISTEKIEEAISALTGALDGTYESEAEAVKMAIMKAVKSVS